ncbi:fasciclin domain-containing protein [Aeromicrobium sp.]|uniref:fasciclin domain-containing protein n=1 Tax=Aeromicrobium sp. TaxID=1871063 RepID=UPI002FC968D9
MDGTLKTVNGAELTVTGSGDDIKVGDQASVICGGVRTANATVYLIDSVLMPPAA